MRIIACDDDKKTLALLEMWTKEYMGNVPYQFLAYDNGIDLLNEMENYTGVEPQIVFMDIKLKNDNGIAVAKILNKEYGNVAVIFVSGYTEYFEDSFEADPVYFLIKPLKKESYEKAMEKAVVKITNRERQFLLIKGKNLKRVFFDDICYAESEARKIRLHCKDEIIEYYEKMDDLENMLKKHFIRCHKSFMVNISQIKSMNGKEIALLNGEKIPISRKKAAETKQTVLEYLGGLFNDL